MAPAAKPGVIGRDCAQNVEQSESGQRCRRGREQRRCPVDTHGSGDAVSWTHTGAETLSHGHTPHVNSGEDKPVLSGHTNILSTQFCDLTRYICSFSFRANGNIRHCHSGGGGEGGGGGRKGNEPWKRRIWGTARVCVCQRLHKGKRWALQVHLLALAT